MEPARDDTSLAAWDYWANRARECYGVDEGVFFQSTLPPYDTFRFLYTLHPNEPPSRVPLSPFEQALHATEVDDFPTFKRFFDPKWPEEDLMAIGRETYAHDDIRKYFFDHAQLSEENRIILLLEEAILSSNYPYVRNILTSHPYLSIYAFGYAEEIGDEDIANAVGDDFLQTG